MIKETIPFNFDELQAKLTKMFADKGYDSNYEGSNVSSTKIQYF